jgi:putative glutamine amidotransferase
VTARILIVGPDTRDSYLKPYKDAVRLAGGDPVRDWPTPEMIKSEKFLKVFLRLYGGVLLPGGTDIQPKLYGQEPLSKLRPTDRELDEGQLAIARMLIKHSIPTLAICRGLQVAAVAAGAALYQDLSSERTSGVNHLISEPKDALAHGVELVLDSRLAGLCGASVLCGGPVASGGSGREPSPLPSAFRSLRRRLSRVINPEFPANGMLRPSVNRGSCL